MDSALVSFVGMGGASFWLMRKAKRSSILNKHASLARFRIQSGAKLIPESMMPPN